MTILQPKYGRQLSMQNLANAIRLTPSSRVALVGAGGKTTILFRIAHDYIDSAKAGKQSILLSTSTHLAAGQVQQADLHIIVQRIEDFDAFQSQLPPGLILFTGQFTTTAEYEDRALGLSDEMLTSLRLLADKHHVPLLIEADGARKRPLKAPADHEPAIPIFCNTVLVVAGLSGLGQSLTPEWVHRPEQFALISGLQIGQTISEQDLLRVLLHEEAGQKNIPANARRIVLFTQAIDAMLQARANTMAKSLLPHYQAVIITKIDPGHPSEPTKNRADIVAIHEPVAGIILAAGGSSRFGSPKSLLTWKGETFIERITRISLEGGLSPVVIVAGDALNQVKTIISKWNVTLVHNPKWQAGQSTSIHAGLNAIPTSCGAAIFLLADQPQVSRAIISALIEAHARSLAPIIAPQVDQERANPVLFDYSTFPRLLEIQGDQGGRALFSKYQVHWLPWQDKSLLSDIDTPQDYQRLLNNE
jgi:molybdenum cofactor cytidylyltransferase